MSNDASVTIFHNPACSTSRNALQAIRNAGRDASVVEYLKAGWSRSQLQDLFRQAGVTPREALRTRGGRAEELGLTADGASDDQILDAMVADPALVERPFVVSDKGAVLARPVERVREIL